MFDKLSPGCQRERMILEQQVAENIELRPNLLKSCQRERQLFCGAVQPGGARVFRCLAENLGDGDFGNTCRTDMIRKLQRRCVCGGPRVGQCQGCPVARYTLLPGSRAAGWCAACLAVMAVCLHADAQM